VNRPRDIRHYLIDIEGVLVRDKCYEPIAGSVDWYNGLTDRGYDRLLVSNNTTHTPEGLAEALRGAGFDVTVDDLVTAVAAGAHLLRSWGKTRLLWLGSQSLVDWWREAGFELVEDGDCDAVVLGLNADLTVADLDRALPSLVDHGAELVALHCNLFYLDGHGERRFGPGFYSDGLTRAARREPVVIGKPHERIYRLALEKLGGRAEQALFISDDPLSDLITAKRMGMSTAFVLSGKYPDHAVLGDMDQTEWPDLIADRPASLDTEIHGATDADTDGD